MKYVVNSTIKHNGSVYEAGDVLDLSSKEVEALGDSDTIAPAHVPFARQLKTPLGETYE